MGSRAKAVLRVVSGNLLEMYDFMVYGYYAKAIGLTFFPGQDAFASTLASLVTFGAAYLMRPLGAVLLGSYIDRLGRRKGLLLTLSIMAVGSAVIAFTPGYASLGLLAPLLVTLGRLLQGLSAGVELGGVSVYLSEISPPGQKGFYVAWQSASQQVAVVMAAFIGYAVGQRLSEAEMLDWGWRVPFWVGCLIIPFLFMVRRTLEETPEFEAQKHHPELPEILASIRKNWRLVAQGLLLVTMTTVSFYTVTTSVPTLGEALHLKANDSLLVTTCVGLSNFFWLPVMGALSDRVGRRPLLMLFSALALFTAYPSMAWLASAPSFTRLLLVELWLAWLYACYNGAMVVALTELMPAQVRTTGFSLAYSLATALGGFTPTVCLLLIHYTQRSASPGLWMSAAALCGLLASWRLPTQRA